MSECKDGTCHRGGKTHCDHWFAGEACCRCGAPELEEVSNGAPAAGRDRPELEAH